jgi:hypothetical protein
LKTKDQKLAFAQVKTTESVNQPTIEQLSGEIDFLEQKKCRFTSKIYCFIQAKSIIARL